VQASGPCASPESGDKYLLVHGDCQVLSSYKEQDFRTSYESSDFGLATRLLTGSSPVAHPPLGRWGSPLKPPTTPGLMPPDDLRRGASGGQTLAPRFDRSRWRRRRGRPSPDRQVGCAARGGCLSWGTLVINVLAIRVGSSEDAHYERIVRIRYDRVAYRAPTPIAPRVVNAAGSVMAGEPAKVRIRARKWRSVTWPLFSASIRRSLRWLASSARMGSAKCSTTLPSPTWSKSRRPAARRRRDRKGAHVLVAMAFAAWVLLGR
jgi:hypothetical protein